MRCVSWFLVLLCFFGVRSSADDLVPAYLIRLPPTVETVFVAETSAARFHHFENAEGIDIEYRGNSYMSIGQNGDGKQRNGDRKTPLGIYFVTEQLDTRRMHEKYGATAFTLDYPNALDRRMKRTGEGIWVHGVDRRKGARPPWDTDGCIALPNEDLAVLEGEFLPNVTPVLVTRRLDWVSRGRIAALRRELDAAVSLWASSQQNGDMHAYLSLYHEDFRHWGMDKTEWTAFRMQTLAARPIENVAVSDVLLLGEPQEHETYLSRFRMVTIKGESRVIVTKRLYWRREEDGALQIIAEDAG